MLTLHFGQRRKKRSRIQRYKLKRPRADPENYSSCGSGGDTKQETENLSVPGKGWGPKTATKKLNKSKWTDFPQNGAALSTFPPF